MYICAYVYMHTCIYVYMYICIYIYTYIDIYNAESNRPNRCITLLVGIFLWMLHENGPTKPLSPPFCNRRQDIQGSKWEITTAWVTWSWFWRQWDLSCLGVKSELFTGNVFFLLNHRISMGMNLDKMGYQIFQQTLSTLAWCSSLKCCFLVVRLDDRKVSRVKVFILP